MLSTPYIREKRRKIGDDKSVSPSSNWSDLPPNLLRLIYRKLYDTFDFIYFRAVCKSWLAAAPLSDHPPQLPFILERKTFFSSEMKLYSLHTGKTCRIQVPEAHDKLFVGQSHGYLITEKIGCKDSFVTLLNPFTRAEVPFPIQDIRHCRSFVTPLNPFMRTEVPFPIQGLRYCRPLHVISADRIRNSANVGICMTMGIGTQFVGFWKYDQNNEWAFKACFSSSIEAHNSGSMNFPNFIRYCTAILDYTTGNKLEVWPPYNDFRKRDFYCLGDGAGAFIGIQRHFHSSDTKFWFEVYRLDEELESPCWVKLSNIGDMVIFLNSDGTGFCLSASAFNGISGNCIYFVEMGHRDTYVIGLYELTKDESEVIGQLESEGIWIVPNVY